MRTAAVGLIAATLLAETVSGIRWSPATGWKSECTAPMRAATYKIAPAGSDQEGAECVVYFFGTGQGPERRAAVAFLSPMVITRAALSGMMMFRRSHSRVSARFATAQLLKAALRGP
jgi:hypothetical protein